MAQRLAWLYAQAVTAQRDAPIRHISGERVDNELAALCQVGHRVRLRAADVVLFRILRTVVRKQYFAFPRIDGPELPVALTEEHQIAGNKHARLRGLSDTDLPNHFTSAGVRGSVQAEGSCTRNMIEEG